MDQNLLNKYVGIPFKLGGNTTEGIDCIHIAEQFLQEQGYQVVCHPFCTEEWLKKADYNEWLELVKSYGEPITIEELEENDIIYFAWKNEIHAGIYVGYGKYLHITTKSVSHISRLNNAAKARIVAIMRPSKTQKKILPPAGRSFMQGLMTVVGVVAGALIGFCMGGLYGAFQGMLIGGALGYQLFSPGPGEEGAGAGGDLANSPKYRFGGLRLTRTNELPVPLIYGKCTVSGNIVYSVLSTDELTCYQLIALGEGEVNSITNIKVYGEAIANFTGSSNTPYYGTSTQIVDTRAVACYGLRYTAYVAHTWLANEKLPNLPTVVTYLVEGLKVSTWNGTIWSTAKTYSNNPAACIRDYLMRAKELGGCELSASNISDNDFGEVYDYCNGQVSDGEGGFENRYELNYVIDTKRTAIDNLNDLLASFGGYFIITGTTVKIGVKKVATSVYSFDMSSIKANSFEYSYIPKDNSYNRIGIQYVDADQADIRPVTYVDDFISQDEEGLREKVLPMFGIGRYSQAARVAWQLIYDLKVNSIICAFETDILGMHIEPGDIIDVTHDVPGWTKKTFLVAAIEEKEENEYALQCIAYNSSVYNDSYGSGIMTYDYGSAPNLYGAPPDVAVFTVTSDGINLIFEWDRVDEKIDIKIGSYEIREGYAWELASVVQRISADQDSYRTPIRISGVRNFLIKARTTYSIYSANALSDSITIDHVEGANIILSQSMFEQANLDSGTPSADGQLIWTPNYNSEYYRRAVGVKTATTWEEHETAGRTWDELEVYNWDIPVVGTEQTFEFPEVDVGELHTLVSTSIAAEYSGDSSDVTIEWRYGTASPLVGAYATFVPGEYTYQYVQFNIKITCSDTDVPSYLDDLFLRIDVFDITVRGKNVAVTAPGGATVTFDTEFGATPAIVVSTVGASPYTAIITSKTAAGFVVKLYNAAGVEQSGVIDWLSRGWLDIS